MRLLITGAFGFIGRHLLSSLLQEKDTEVYLLDRDRSLPSGFPTRQETGRTFAGIFQVDLRDRQQIEHSLASCQPDIIFHLAAAGVGNPFLPLDDAISHNLYGTLNLLQAAFSTAPAVHPPQKVIISRTPGEYSAMNPYAASKAAAWQFCRMYARTKGWPIFGSVIFQAYGPGQPPQRLLPAAIIAALKGQDLPMTAGEQQKDWIYISDIISGFLAIRNADLAPGTSVELGSGQLTSVAEVVQQIYAIIGGPGRPLIGALPTRPGEDFQQSADAAHTVELIDWRSAVPLVTGLNKTIDFLRQPVK